MSDLAFEIGFDHYLFDLPLDISRFQDNHRQQIRYGYEAAKMQKVSQKRPDFYEKKLMTIRDRALVKGLEVSISVKDLHTKLEETKGCCPITELPFTFAENNATDWSVDRVDNTRGYCLDNIEIISVIANQAKSNLDLSGIIKNALGKAKTEDLLTGREWLRMARFYYQRMKIMRPLCICLLLTDSQPLYDHIVFMQLFKNEEKRAKAFLKKLEKYSSKDAVMKATKLTQKRIYHRADSDVEVLYDSPKLYRWVQSFITAMNAHCAEFDPLLMDCMFA
ncbi:MAG: hypothetical protein Q8S55_22030 [Methylococcaceae bacterium]|jgi:hypothetical protein|nr:hypothetical protein [Methylococcaceae bacterium]